MRGDTTQNSSSLKGIGTLSSRGVFGDLGSLFGVWGDPWVGKSSGSEKKRGNFSGSVGGGGGGGGSGSGSKGGSGSVGMGGVSTVGGDWKEMYVVLQGNRLIWWNNEYEIDEYKSCNGQLLLYGHAGTTQASPVIVRELGSSGFGLTQYSQYESRLLCVFGRDASNSPQRCTILCGDSESKELLTKLIMDLLS